MNDQIIERYLKVANLASDGGTEGEKTAAKETLKKLIEKYPRLPVEAAKYLAAKEIAEKGSGVKAAAGSAAATAAATAVQHAPVSTPFGDALRHLFTQTVNALGEDLANQVQEGVEEFWDQFDPLNPLESIMQQSANPYLNMAIEEALDEAIQEMDPEDNDLRLEEDEDSGEEFLRVELTLPIDLVEAISATRENKARFVDWLTDGVFDEEGEGDDDDE